MPSNKACILHHCLEICQLFPYFCKAASHVSTVKERKSFFQEANSGKCQNHVNDNKEHRAQRTPFWLQTGSCAMPHESLQNVEACCFGVIQHADASNHTLKQDGVWGPVGASDRFCSGIPCKLYWDNPEVSKPIKVGDLWNGNSGVPPKS